MKKNAFTLVELLATITILGILLGIAIPAVLGYINQGKETYYHSLEDSVLNSARDYLI
ncbi:MAG TPA: type II secretion system protein, partial [Candidatus Scybalousia intestinigallinarum]|nr:type II secretion system protein [Candidatus Scybalousia intestinigallinarum]